MRSLNEIVAESDKATKQARTHKVQPYVALRNGDVGVKTVPMLGYYQPKGWVHVDTYFVDSSGWGNTGESALTFDQFLTKVKKGYGYGIRSMGQFQIYINEFRKVQD